MQIKYLNHLPDEFKASAVRLFLDALGEKLVPVLGDDDRTHKLLENSLDPTQCLAAIHERKLVGLLAIKDSNGGFLNPTVKALTQTYGVLGGLYRLFGLAILDSSTTPGEYYVDGVAVAEEVRGQGVGSQLFNRLEELAVERGIKAISLAVIDTNPRAETLYKRLGFATVRCEKVWPFNRIFGFPFQSATFMVKKIDRHRPVTNHAEV